MTSKMYLKKKVSFFPFFINFYLILIFIFLGYEPNFKMPYEVPPYVMSRIEKQSQLPLTEHFVHGRDNGSSG